MNLNLNIPITIPDELIQDAVTNVIKGRVIHLLRNDEALKSIINETIDKEIQKRLHKELSAQPMEWRLDYAVAKCLPDKQQMTRAVMVEIKGQVGTILAELKGPQKIMDWLTESEKQVLREHYKNEQNSENNG